MKDEGESTKPKAAQPVALSLCALSVAVAFLCFSSPAGLLSPELCLIFAERSFSAREQFQAERGRNGARKAAEETGSEGRTRNTEQE